MKESLEEWTSVDRKPRNKGHNKHKKSGKAERVPVKTVKNNSLSAAKASNNNARKEKVNLVRTEVAVVSRDSPVDGEKGPSETRPWTNVPSFMDDSAPMDLSMSNSMKQLNINNTNPDQMSPSRFVQLCRSFDWRASPKLTLQTRGLVNTGCACFRNSILQALLALPTFMTLICAILLEVEDPVNIPPPFVTWRELVSLYKEFTPAWTNSSGFSKKTRHGTENVHANVFMATLFPAFASKVAAFRPPRQAAARAGGGSQEDAMEFLTFLLDTLHEEIAQHEALHPVSSDSSNGSGRGILPSTVSLASSLVAAADALVSDGWNTVFTKKNVKVVVDDKTKDLVAKASDASVISKLFHSTLRSEVVYKAKKERSVTFQRLFCVTLDIASTAMANSSPRHASVSIGQCLDAYFSEEVIDDNIKKQLRFDSLPETLVLQLSRFSFDHYRNVSTKIMREVDFPVDLDLTADHMSPDLVSRLGSSSSPSGSSSASYELSAAVLHHGESVSKGHYSTLARDRAGQWHSLNDTKVTSLSEAQVVSGSSRSLVYILFYSRKAAVTD